MPGKSLLLPFAALLVLCFSCQSGQDVSRITKDDLKAELGSPNLVLLDVRHGKDWSGSDAKIPGAIRPDVSKPTKEWAKDLPKNKDIVLYCA